MQCGDEKIEICFQGGAGKLPAAFGGRDNSAGSGSIVVTGSKVNLRKIF